MSPKRSSTSKRMKSLKETIESFRELKVGWDSYGALPTDARAIKTALGLVDGFRVVPTNDGGVQFEGYVGKEYVEIEIEPDGTINNFAIFDDCILVGQWRRDGKVNA